MNARTSDVDWSDLETFKSVGAKLSRSLITINPSLTMTLSAGFVHEAKEELADSTHVRLSFSRRNNIIVFEFISDADAPGAIKMTRKGNTTFAVRSFLNYNKLDIQNIRGKYKPQLLNVPKRGACWLINLNEKVS